MKNVLRLTVASAAAASLVVLTGCGASPDSQSSGGDKLLIWVDATREPVAQAYASEVGEGVDVTVEVVDDALAKIALFNTTGSGWPDVMFTGEPNAVAELASESNGFAAPLDEVVPSEVIDGYGTSNSWCEIDDKTYCLKNDLGQTVLWYDLAVFNELSLTPPKTMDDFAETALTLKAAGYLSGAIGGQALYTGYLQPSECPLSDASGMTVRIDPEAEECTRVLDLLQPLVNAGALDTRSPFDAGFISDVAKAGKVAMTVGPSWFGDFVIKPAESWAVPAGRIAAAPMPTWDGTPSSGAWGGGIWLTSSHSESPQAAADAAVWLATSDKAHTEAPTYPAYGPANTQWAKRVATDTYYAADPYPAMQAAAENLSAVNKPVLYDISALQGSVLQPELDGGKTLAAAFGTFAEAVVAAAKAAGYEVTD